jgi:hypothetical protein
MICLEFLRSFNVSIEVEASPKIPKIPFRNVDTTKVKTINVALIVVNIVFIIVFSSKRKLFLNYFTAYPSIQPHHCKNKRD